MFSCINDEVFTSQGLLSAVQTTRREPFVNKNGGTGSMDTEHENQAPRGVIVRLCKTGEGGAGEEREKKLKIRRAVYLHFVFRA